MRESIYIPHDFLYMFKINLIRSIEGSYVAFHICLIKSLIITYMIYYKQPQYISRPRLTSNCQDPMPKELLKERGILKLPGM